MSENSGKIDFGYENETSPVQARAKAMQTIFESLGLDGEQNLENFSERLNGSIKTLPQYQRFEQAMKDIRPEALPYEVFKAIRKSNDVPEQRAGIPTDGVLISSIRQGHIECAGRTYIASVYMQEKGIPHAVVEAPSHSMLLIEIGNDTLAYCDANHDLFFTFPRTALKGYQGVTKISQCSLETYTPRSNDTADGLNIIYNNFIVVPPQEGVTRQYLGSVKAALAKLPEFQNTQIEKDKEAAKAIDSILQDILGPENELLKDYFEKDDKMTKERASMREGLHNMFSEASLTLQTPESFANWFSSFIESETNTAFPYLKGSKDLQNKYAQELYSRLKN